MSLEHKEKTLVHEGKSRPRTPWLEWLASFFGLALFLITSGVIGRQVFDNASPPEVIVEVHDISSVEGGYRVIFRARNSAGGAAAQVEIEGTVTKEGPEAEISRVVLDYIPGHSARKGGLFFSHDPRIGTLTVRATGFAVP